MMVLTSAQLAILKADILADPVFSQWAATGRMASEIAAGGTITDTSRWDEDQTVAAVTGSVTGNVGGNVTDSVGSVTGNVVGSVGSVAGNVTGSVGSVAGDVSGKVLGGGAGVITGIGVWAAGAAGAAVALASTITTVLNRLGNWTGAGLNTVLGAMRALAAKAAGLTPADISAGTTYNNVTDSNEAIRDSGGGAPTVAQIDAQLSATHGAGLWGGAAGAGAEDFVYTVTDSGTGLPLGNVQVWCTTDIAGVNVIASGITDAFGQVTFFLDPGDWYFFRERPGYAFVNPDHEHF